MGNLVIAVIAVAFAAALSLAGVSYLNRGADIAHTEQVNNTTQVESLLADYEALRQNIGHRPATTDYQSVYSTTSGNKYAYGSGSVTVPSRMDGAPGQWTYLPGCDGGNQDCFYMKVQGASSTIYQAVRNSAMQELATPTTSRLQLSTTQADDPNALTNPASWPATPPATFYLTLRMASGTTATVNQGVQYYYTPKATYYLKAPACGETEEYLNSNWTCIQNPGNTTVAQSYCASNQPPAEQPTTDMTGCISYSGVVTGPGTCTGGKQTSTWICLSSNGTQVATSYCSGYVPPTLSCGSGGSTLGSGSGVSNGGSGSGTVGPISGGGGSASVSYSYIVSNISYGSCTAGCGASTQPATSWTCTRSDGTPANPSLCGTPAALTCTSYATCSPQNVTYGTCSNQCGSGTAPLVSFICGDVLGDVVGNNYCTAPASTQACTSTAGCTYTWTNANYLACAPACGASTEAINVSNPGTCTRSDGTVVSPTYCYNAGEISLTKSCTNYSLCTPQTTYGNCSNQCGAGTQTLTGSSCVDSNGNPLPASDCPTAPTTQSCYGTSSCTYTASAPVYNSCSSSCGTGQETVKSFTCTRSDGQVVDSSYCTTPAAKSCSNYSGCQVTGATYGACSNQCGAGTQTLQNSNWTCTDGNGNTVPSSHCTPPSGTQSCYGTSSCTYAPANVSYGSCQPACGTSTKSVSYTCLRSDGQTVSNSYCNAPSAQTCTNYSECQAIPVYGSCSTSCGTGTETLQSWTCVAPNGQPAPGGQSNCTAPASSTSCTVTAGCTYHSVPVYGSCAPGCGASTQSLSSWTCQTQNGTTVAKSNCSTPASTIACTDNSECGQITYVAQVNSYGSCLSGGNCGSLSTLQVLSWQCNEFIAGVEQPNPVDDSNCTTPTGPACTYTGNCYGYTYQSGSATYSGCSASCGPGTELPQTWNCVRSDGTIVSNSVEPDCQALESSVPAGPTCNLGTCH